MFKDAEGLRDAVIEAARNLRVSPYPAHGSGLILRVTAVSFEALKQAVDRLDGKSQT